MFDGPDGRTFRDGGRSRESQKEQRCLNTDHSADDGRKRVRWDYADESRACAIQAVRTVDALPECRRSVVSRRCPDALESSGPTRPPNWEGAGLGLDRWAVVSAETLEGVPARHARRLRSRECKTPTFTSDDLNGDGSVDEPELSRASERATPEMDR